VYLLESTAPRRSWPLEVCGFIERENPGDWMCPPLDNDSIKEVRLPEASLPVLQLERPATAAKEYGGGEVWLWEE
jgi:hypothetical protein